MKVKKKVKKKVSTPCLVASNKDALIARQDNILCGKPRGQFHDHYLYVQRGDCGCVCKYQNPDGIPDTNVTCEHGNKIIVYTDKPNKNEEKYQKKPIVVDAMKWTGENKYAILKFASPVASYYGGGMRILTPSEGTVVCNLGDFIIKEPFGEEFKFSLCEPDVFMETYKKVLPAKAKSKEADKSKK